MDHTAIETQLKNTLEAALSLAQKKGATAAAASARAGSGLDATVRYQKPDTLEHFQDNHFSITVYIGQKTGAAATSDLSKTAIQQAVSEAIQIAQFTEPDPCAGLPDPENLARTWPELSLYHPWHLDPAQAIALAAECEAIALQTPGITQSEGTSVNTYNSVSAYGNSLGFLNAYAQTHHSLHCTTLAEANGHMQRDSGYTTARDPKDLRAPESVAREATDKTLKRLHPKPIKTQSVPVLFHAEAATSLIQHLISALLGKNLYRKASFLVDHLDAPLFPSFLSIEETPFLPKGLASCPYDTEGVAVMPSTLIDSGVLKHYLLGSYSARKLGLCTTGHAGGAHNILVSQGTLSLPALIKHMDTGLLITDLLGQGVNLMTGDYSRGATGFWVSKGIIQHPVEEITIAGNLKDMFRHIATVGKDLETRGSIHVGSILIECMRVAGNAT